MKAIGVIRPDFTPRVYDVDEPTAGLGEVVVDVIAASVSDFDRAAIRGRYPGMTHPLFLGRDFVGRVTAVGADVGYIDVGMDVAGVAAPRAPEQPGTFSQKVAVPANLLAPIPDGVDLVHAAGVGLAGLTAVSALDALGPVDLGNLLINGRLDGVGGYALQVAKARGAVVAVVTRPEEVELARCLGADAAIPDSADPTEAIRRARYFLDGRVDSAIHIEGNPLVVASAVRPGGKFTSVADPVPQMTRSDIEYRPTVVSAGGHRLADLLFKVASGRMRSYVRHAVPFDRISNAIDPSSSDTDGATVLVRR